MQVGPIALLLRAANTRFGNRVSGAAEYSRAIASTLNDEAAFVIRLSDTASPNMLDSSISQVLTERFVVMVALKNDTLQSDKVGIIATDAVDDVRDQLFSVLINLWLPRAEGPVSYVSGNLYKIDSGYIWWQFIFEAPFRLCPDGVLDTGIVTDGNITDLLEIFSQITSQGEDYEGPLPAQNLKLMYNEILAKE